MDRQHSIVVGIDFGTTYSGVAFARDGEPNRIHFVSNWNSKSIHCFTKQKVPSAIYYGACNEPPSWGYDVTTEVNAIRWFKLLLLDDDHMPAHVKDSEYITRAKALLQRENKHATEVVADCLRELWKHSLRAIEKAIGERMVSLSIFKLVVTVPAIWPPHAQMRMHEAIVMAGMLHKRSAGETSLSFLPEPEAAALATLDKMSARPDMKKNDDFVVCDAGGGTVDIISYKIVKAKPMTVRESVPGDGRLCGAVRLDEAFSSLLVAKMPKDMLMALSPAELNKIIYDNWENGIKLEFINDDKSWTAQIPFSASLANVRLAKDITLGRDDIWWVFKDVLAEVAELVLHQTRQAVKSHHKPPKYVLLVGGFGRSRILHDYLRKRIKIAFKRIDIVQEEGADPWTAICHGAVIKGLAKKQSPTSAQAKLVDSRFARASIGTLFNVVPFDEEEHDEEDKEWCPVQQQYQAADQVEWFVLKGDVIKDNEPKGYNFFQPLTEQPSEIINELVYSYAMFAPERCTAAVRKLCRVRWSSVPDFKTLPKAETESGDVFRELNYEIKVVTHGVSQDFQVFYKGKMVAAQSVDVDFSESGRSIK